jgi:carbon-monoxide dehydrogenase large subunit
VAFIVAETLAQARDAAELIELDIDEAAGEARHRAGGEPLHDEVPDNVPYSWELGDEAATDAALAVPPMSSR